MAPVNVEIRVQVQAVQRQIGSQGKGDFPWVLLRGNHTLYPSSYQHRLL